MKTGREKSAFRERRGAEIILNLLRLNAFCDAALRLSIERATFSTKLSRESFRAS